MCSKRGKTTRFMGKGAVEKTGLNDLLYKAGFWAERLANITAAASGQAAEAAEDAADEMDDAEDDVFDALGEHAPEGLTAFAGTLAAGWIAKRLLEPREVNWPRAVLAGIVGTLLYDLEMAVDQRLFGRKFGTIQPLGEAVADDEETAAVLGYAGHYAAGVGLAALYARYLYGRLPGTPLTQGAFFGALDAATLNWGGVMPMLSRVSPAVKLPLGYAGLSRDPEITAQTLLRHLAYGVGVGLVYRAPGDEYDFE